MNKRLFLCFGILLVLTFNVQVLAQEETVVTNEQEALRTVPKDYAENYAFDDPEKRKSFLELTKNLRCPKCQNQNIADSNAMIAHDMRRKVYQMLKDGKSEEQVIAFMKGRYNDFVYYKPPVNAFTIWLWVLPVLFVVLMLGIFLMRRKTVDDENSDEKIAQAEALLKDE
ncbi:cytochrome c-type biogenesis protein [Glaciecola sp. 1036]|uniref:cytochrome c-type biogenesis protein n=1 Tax=Alteromonadaceae TaxID=72275 RepID=UPI003D05AFEE